MSPHFLQRAPYQAGQRAPGLHVHPILAQAIHTQRQHVTSPSASLGVSTMDAAAKGLAAEVCRREAALLPPRGGSPPSLDGWLKVRVALFWFVLRCLDARSVHAGRQNRRNATQRHFRLAWRARAGAGPWQVPGALQAAGIGRLGRGRPVRGTAGHAGAAPRCVWCVAARCTICRPWAWGGVGWDGAMSTPSSSAVVGDKVYASCTWPWFHDQRRLTCCKFAMAPCCWLTPRRCARRSQAQAGDVRQARPHAVVRSSSRAPSPARPAWRRQRQVAASSTARRAVGSTAHAASGNSPRAQPASTSQPCCPKSSARPVRRSTPPQRRRSRCRSCHPSVGIPNGGRTGARRQAASRVRSPSGAT